MNGTTHTDESGRSLGTLVRDLTHDISDLIRSEIALARAETSEKVAKAGTAIASVAVGAVFGLAALIIVLQAVVIALANIMEPWLASAIVGVAVAALAWFMINKGQKDLKATSLMPERTTRNVRRDAQVAADQTSSGHAKSASSHSINPAQSAAGHGAKQEVHR